MKLYVLYFSKATKEVVRDEVEVEDKGSMYDQWQGLHTSDQKRNSGRR